MFKARPIVKPLIAIGPLVVAVFICAGWTENRRPVSIPFGEWTGEGVFVQAAWSQRAGQKPATLSEQPTSMHRRYPTSLMIEPRRIDGRDVIWLEICSQRGAIPGMNDLGTDTHIQAALAEARQVSESITLYQMVGFLFNPKGDHAAMQFNTQGPAFSASCTAAGDSLVLQIQYADNFTDTFVFESGKVRKTGMVMGKNSLVTWVEELSRSTENMVASLR